LAKFDCIIPSWRIRFFLQKVKTMSRGEPLIRQWNLLKALQAYHYGLSADELACRLECSKRQVQRDLNVLQEVGFPISYEQRDFGKRFWKLSHHFIESDKLIFSVTEMLSIFLSQKLLAPLAGTQFGEGLDSLFEKIKATLTPRALSHFTQMDSTLLVKSHTFSDYSAHDKTIRLLTKAIQDSVVVNLTYKSQSRQKPYQTRYHPYGMVFFDGDLYCIGLMEIYGQIRTLKLNRIISSELTPDRFRKPADFSIQEQMEGSLGIFSSLGPTQTIRIQLDGWAASSVREAIHHPSQKILDDNDSRVIVQFKLADTTELKRWLLSFGCHACILSPKQLADQIASEIKKMSQRYTKK